VPVDPDSFSYYGQNLLPNFDALPTWKYATPHNLQRITPQNETCNACHGNAEFFLTEDDVASGELDANKDVIVEELPFAMP
jgi:thiosulfate/3-mercaptopyruvate sulfurtransferase